MEEKHVSLPDELNFMKKAQKDNITYINDNYIGDKETETIYFKERLGFFVISQE